MNATEARELVGCCGLYCGLCNKYQSQAASRCLGCKVGSQHEWCSIWNCCVKKRGYETCTECEDLFECSIYLRRKVVEWIPAAANLGQIKASGLRPWLAEQMARQALVEALLRDYNEGRSMSFYCKACARLPVEAIQGAMSCAQGEILREDIAEADLKSRARRMKAALQEAAERLEVDLRS
jgi:hypothetical protein